eukprot:TRINITY_DN14174_c0_g1_i1.p1 TRINITY_DN14174_c0_g1~~TRINITY_DN14174_c0_g1_i1.p1  ORF type:complete len:101 (+),score=8.78 TRINITY_DN14174_c0_g1_i1:297-599(+)
MFVRQLFLIFDLGKKLQKALELVDKNLCTRLIAVPSGRSVFKVEGGSTQRPSSYLCFSHYCSCRDFYNSVIKNEGLYCKHQIAVFISEAIGSINLSLIHI